MSETEETQEPTENPDEESDEESEENISPDEVAAPTEDEKSGDSA